MAAAPKPSLNLLLPPISSKSIVWALLPISPTLLLTLTISSLGHCKGKGILTHLPASRLSFSMSSSSVTRVLTYTGFITLLTCVASIPLQPLPPEGTQLLSVPCHPSLNHLPRLSHCTSTQRQASLDILPLSPVSLLQLFAPLHSS